MASDVREGRKEDSKIIRKERIVDMQSINNVIKEIILNCNNDVECVIKKSQQKQIVIFGAGQLGHKV